MDSPAASSGEANPERSWQRRAKILETIGILARPAEGGSPYDRFKGRLLFSIHDAQGRPVGIGGRVLPELGTTSPGQIHQFAGNAAVHQEQAALRPRPGPRDAAKDPHGAGDGGLHRRDRGPSVRVPERGGRAGHGVGRVAHPHPEGPRRPDRAGARRRRGGHAAGQRSVGVVRRPAGRPADSHPAGGPRSVRLSAQVRGGRRFRELLADQGGRCPGSRLRGDDPRHRRGARRPRRQPGDRGVARDRGEGPAAAAAKPRGDARFRRRRSCSGWRASSASTSWSCGGG